MKDIEKRLRELGHELRGPQPRGKIEHGKVVGDLLFVSGQGPHDADGKLNWVGRVGAEVSLEDGYLAAERCGVNLLGAAKSALGTLDRIEEVVKVLAFVNSAPDFHRQPLVVHGCTDLLESVLGTAGRHARSAIGTSNLPNNQPVEIEAIFRVRPE